MAKVKKNQAPNCPHCGLASVVFKHIEQREVFTDVGIVDGNLVLKGKESRTNWELGSGGHVCADCGRKCGRAAILRANKPKRNK